MASQSDSDFPTVIGPDAVFKGELKFEKGVKHLGQFDGQIETKGHIMIAEGARLTGEVRAGSVDVQGEVKGNLNAAEKVRLAATAKLEGDLETSRLEVAEGAVFIGRCIVGSNGSAGARSARPDEGKAGAGQSAGGGPAKQPQPQPQPVGAKK